MNADPATLADLVTTSIAVRATRSRRAKAEAIASLLARLGPDDLALAALYLAGEIRQGSLQVGWSTVGDLPLDAPAAAGGPPRLTEIDETFEVLRGVEGAGAAARRRDLLATLFARTDAEGRRFLAGLLLGELRQGAQRAQVVEALARRFAVEAEELRRALTFAGSFAETLATLVRDGQPGLARLAVPRPLVPIEPMLADSAATIDAAFADGGEAGVEWKLDGVRVQVHVASGEVRVFSRQLRDITALVPDVVAFAAGLPAQSLIADGEVVAFDARGRPLPFQDFMSVFSREQKAGAGAALPPMRSVFFDLLHQDGRSLVDAPYRERRAALAAALPAEHVIEQRFAADAGAGQAMLDAAMAAGHEGVMVKAADAPYSAGRRGAAWIKVKPATTLDLVILAAEWGHGRRHGWLSNLHLGARVPGEARFLMLGKTFKGMTDAMLRELTVDLQQIATRSEPGVVHVRPERVVEIAFDSVQQSRRYDSGFALRFARVKRFRFDKRAEEANTIDDVRREFERRR